MNLSKVFVGMPRWNRPTHEVNRVAILAGDAKCICVPSTATRVVVEMWGQGGGGSPSACCTTGIYGGQGGSYSSKVFAGLCSPATMGTCILFCGCVCTCDCMAVGVLATAVCGHCGQYSWLKNCNQTGIISNFSGNLETILEEFNMITLFDFILDSYYIGHSKPSPEIFKVALGKSRVSPSEILYSGDNIERDVIPAKQLKMKTALIYDLKRKDLEDYLSTSPADFNAPSLDALFKEIQSR